MLKIAIVTDGPYGDRAYEFIGKGFDTEFIELEQPLSSFADEIDIPDDAAKKILNKDILITYTLHPDLTLDLIDMFHDKVEWIIVAAWRGEGFKRQLEMYKNVTCPENICDLQENGDEVFDEFVSKFGRPIVRINC